MTTSQLTPQTQLSVSQGDSKQRLAWLHFILQGTAVTIYLGQCAFLNQYETERGLRRQGSRGHKKEPKWQR
jgi:hypothetical protein